MKKKSLFILCKISVNEDVSAYTYSYNNVATSVGQVAILLVKLFSRYYCLCRVICHWLLYVAFHDTAAEVRLGFVKMEEGYIEGNTLWQWSLLE